MTESVPWTKSYSQEIAAEPGAVWALLADTSTWKLWNTGVGAIEIAGPFASGTWFAMRLPDGEILRTQLIDVRELQSFTDETWMGETVIRVEHRVEPLAQGHCRVTFAAEAAGPDAALAGAGASADFPEVLAALVAFAETRASR